MAELCQLAVGPRSAHLAAQVQAGQGADAIDTVGIAAWQVVGRLQVGIGLDRFAEELPVSHWVEAVGDDGAVLGDQVQEQRREIAECGDLLAVLVEHRLEQSQGVLGCRAGLGCKAAHLVPLLHGQGAADAAGGRPRRVDALAAERRDDLLAERPQPNAAARQVGVGPGQAEDVPGLGRALEAEHPVGRAEVEDAQGVRPNDLGEVEQPPQLRRGRWDVHRHDLVSGIDAIRAVSSPHTNAPAPMRMSMRKSNDELQMSVPSSPSRPACLFKKGAATAVSVSTGSKPRWAGCQQLRYVFSRRRRFSSSKKRTRERPEGNCSTRFSLSSGQHYRK
jgi:hypothetical protein